MSWETERAKSSSPLICCHRIECSVSNSRLPAHRVNCEYLRPSHSPQTSRDHRRVTEGVDYRWAQLPDPWAYDSAWLMATFAAYRSANSLSGDRDGGTPRISTGCLVAVSSTTSLHYTGSCPPLPICIGTRFVTASVL